MIVILYNSGIRCLFRKSPSEKLRLICLKRIQLAAALAVCSVCAAIKGCQSLFYPVRFIPVL